MLLCEVKGDSLAFSEFSQRYSKTTPGDSFTSELAVACGESIKTAVTHTQGSHFEVYPQSQALLALASKGQSFEKQSNR